LIQLLSCPKLKLSQRRKEKLQQQHKTQEHLHQDHKILETHSLATQEMVILDIHLVTQADHLVILLIVATIIILQEQDLGRVPNIIQV